MDPENLKGDMSLTMATTLFCLSIKRTSRENLMNIVCMDRQGFSTIHQPDGRPDLPKRPLNLEKKLSAMMAVSARQRSRVAL